MRAKGVRSIEAVCNDCQQEARILANHVPVPDSTLMLVYPPGRSTSKRSAPFGALYGEPVSRPCGGRRGRQSANAHARGRFRAPANTHRLMRFRCDGLCCTAAKAAPRPKRPIHATEAGVPWPTLETRWHQDNHCRCEPRHGDLPRRRRDARNHLHQQARFSRLLQTGDSPSLVVRVSVPCVPWRSGELVPPHTQCPAAQERRQVMPLLQIADLRRRRSQGLAMALSRFATRAKCAYPASSWPGL
jgi:hypothetical protein